MRAYTLVFVSLLVLMTQTYTLADVTIRSEGVAGEIVVKARGEKRRFYRVSSPERPQQHAFTPWMTLGEISDKLEPRIVKHVGHVEHGLFYHPLVATRWVVKAYRGKDQSYMDLPLIVASPIIVPVDIALLPVYFVGTSNHWVRKKVKHREVRKFLKKILAVKEGDSGHFWLSERKYLSFFHTVEHYANIDG